MANKRKRSGITLERKLELTKELEKGVLSYGFFPVSCSARGRGVNILIAVAMVS